MKDKEFRQDNCECGHHDWEHVIKGSEGDFVACLVLYCPCEQYKKVRLGKAKAFNYENRAVRSDSSRRN